MRVRRIISVLCAAGLAAMAYLPMATGDVGRVDSGAAQSTSLVLTAAPEKSAFLSQPERNLKGCLRGPGLVASLAGVAGLQGESSLGLSGRALHACDIPRVSIGDTSLLSLHCLLVV